MIVLGLETSTARTSVALLDVPDDADVAAVRAGTAGRVLAAEAHVDPRGHGSFLAPAITACLARAGLTVADLGGVAVGTGPGLYTGLRIGIATATALAWARGIPVAGVGGLDAVVLAARRDADLAGVPLVAVLDARRGQWFHATASPAGGTTGAAVGDAAALAAALAEAGPGARAVGEFAGTGLATGAADPGGTTDADAPPLRPDAVDVARLAVAGLRAGGADPSAIAPAYLREADVRIGWAERGGGRSSPAAAVERLVAPVPGPDRAAVLALEAATEARPLGWEALGAEAGRADGCLLGLRGADGALHGFASARLMAGTAHVLRLTVAEGMRRRGHGRALLAGLLAWAGTEGAEAVTLEVRAGDGAARALYLAAGFIESGRRRRYYPDGEDALLLTRPRPVR